jgi:phage-related protein
MGEFAEIAGHNIHKIHEVVSGLITFISNKIGLLVPVMLPYIKLLEAAFQVIGLFFFIHAIVTTIMNTIIPAFKALLAWIDKNPDAFKGLEVTNR